MSIYPDKGRGGKLTGRWRVEVQLNGLKARGRFDTLKQAEDKQKEWLGSLTSGRTPEGVKMRVDPAGIPRSLKVLVRKAWGSLWHGKATAQTNYRKLDIIVEMLGDIPLDDVTTSKMDELEKKLRARGVKENTENRYYTALNTLLKW